MMHTFIASAVVAPFLLTGLRGEFEKIAPDAKGRVGVAAMVLESGESVEFNGSERFPMHSVYKLPIAMVVLRLVDREALKLDQTVKIEESDFVRDGMYSPIRDKYPNGVQPTVAECCATPFPRATAAPAPGNVTPRRQCIARVFRPAWRRC